MSMQPDIPNNFVMEKVNMDLFFHVKSTARTVQPRLWYPASWLPVNGQLGLDETACRSLHTAPSVPLA